MLDSITETHAGCKTETKKKKNRVVTAKVGMRGRFSTLAISCKRFFGHSNVHRQTDDPCILLV